MPNAKILSEKQAIVASLTEKFQNAAAGVIVDYRGITVAEDTELRAKMRENGVEYFVVKNTLARFAAKNAGLDELCDVLEGTTSIAICEGDPVAAAKVVAEFSKKLAAQEKFVIKSGFVDGKVISVDEVRGPGRLAQQRGPGGHRSGHPYRPVRGLATVLDANISGLARVMQAIADQKGA
ncbi:MAG: 50S ribosomal protein L10 [Evtepia gabavorous]